MTRPCHRQKLALLAACECACETRSAPETSDARHWPPSTIRVICAFSTLASSLGAGSKSGRPSSLSVGTKNHKATATTGINTRPPISQTMTNPSLAAAHDESVLSSHDIAPEVPPPVLNDPVREAVRPSRSSRSARSSRTVRRTAALSGRAMPP
jgi:hypothetical protein